MEAAIRLRDLVGRLATLDEEATIYASEPWSADSAAVVAVEPDSGGVPDAAASLGCAYFLEVAVAREFLAGWESTVEGEPTEGEKLARLIRYATDDA